jgi:hypothetical protein
MPLFAVGPCHTSRCATYVVAEEPANKDNRHLFGPVLQGVIGAGSNTVGAKIPLRGRVGWAGRKRGQGAKIVDWGFAVETPYQAPGTTKLALRIDSSTEMGRT